MQIAYAQLAAPKRRNFGDIIYEKRMDGLNIEERKLINEIFAQISPSAYETAQMKTLK
jgi:hypothetical protein